MHPKDDKRWEKTLIFALNAERMEQHTDVTETAKNQMVENEGGGGGGGEGEGREGGDDSKTEEQVFHLDSEYIKNYGNGPRGKWVSKRQRPSEETKTEEIERELEETIRPGREPKWSGEGAFFMPYKASYTKIVVNLKPEVAVQIKGLYLNKNPVVAIEGAEKLVATTVIDCAAGGLDSVPRGIEKMPVIEEVFLGYDNKITELPDWFVAKKSLKVLDLSQLNPLPNGIEKMQQIEEIDMNRSNLTEIPPSIMELKGLKVLRLSKNSLTSIPREIEKLTAIETLCLWENYITEVPSWLWDIKTLKEVHLNENKGNWS